jgi:hypothetical protein
MSRSVVLAGIILMVVVTIMSTYVKSRAQRDLKYSNDDMIMEAEEVSLEFERAWLSEIGEDKEIFGTELVDEIRGISVTILVDEVYTAQTKRIASIYTPYSSYGFGYMNINGSTKWSNNDLRLEHTTLEYNAGLSSHIEFTGLSVSIPVYVGLQYSIRVLQHPINYQTMRIHPSVSDVTVNLQPGLVYLVYVELDDEYYMGTYYRTEADSEPLSVFVTDRDMFVEILKTGETFTLNYSIECEVPGDVFILTWPIPEMLWVDGVETFDADIYSRELEVGTNVGNITFYNMPLDISIIEERVVAVDYRKSEKFRRWDGKLMVDRAISKTFNKS